MTAYNAERARFNMVEQQVRPWNVQDVAVLELIGSMQREAFVPAAYKAMAYADLEIPLGGGQCMLFPRMEARMLQELALQPQDKVLEIGTGSGYMAALMARQAQQVLTLEIDPALASQARANLQQAGVHNVVVRQADGAQGAAADGPFDAIVLSGSVTQIPAALLDQLAVGGRLVAIVGEDPAMQATKVERTGPAEFRTTTPWDVNAPRLQNFPEPSRFAF